VGWCNEAALYMQQRTSCEICVSMLFMVGRGKVRLPQKLLRTLNKNQQEANDDVLLICIDENPKALFVIVHGFPGIDSDALAIMKSISTEYQLASAIHEQTRSSRRIINDSTKLDNNQEEARNALNQLFPVSAILPFNTRQLELNSRFPCDRRASLMDEVVEEENEEDNQEMEGEESPPPNEVMISKVTVTSNSRKLHATILFSLRK
jgi:hypothetical protein